MIKVWNFSISLMYKYRCVGRKTRLYNIYKYLKCLYIYYSHIQVHIEMEIKIAKIYIIEPRLICFLLYEIGIICFFLYMNVKCITILYMKCMKYFYNIHKCIYINICIYT